MQDRSLERRRYPFIESSFVDQVSCYGLVGVESSKLKVGEGALEEGSELVAYAKTCE